jgi:hypothetical protein
MKHLLIALIFIPLSIEAQDLDYEPNTGRSAPGTFTTPEGTGDVGPFNEVPEEEQEKVIREEQRAVQTQEAMDVDPSQMNTSPNPTPNVLNETEKSEKTLSTGEIQPENLFDPGELEAEEAEELDKEEQEDLIDYSTLPDNDED